jgi:pimeloyl-ACP methyl ester carboxylesterase
MRIQINRTTRKIAGVLLLLLLSVTSYGATAGNIEGTWHGTLKLNAMKLSIVMHFSDNACTLDSPDQGAKGIKGEVREITAEKVDVAFPTLNATYTGVLKDGKIEGTFTQMGYKLPLVLEEGQPVRIRPQTPQPPFPYQTEEVSFVNTEDSASLAGTLTYPVGYNSKRKVPVVIMVTGSGLQNRDEELFEHKPFLVIADFLARNGIASLRYDDRGAGLSTGDIENVTTEGFCRDAAAGIAFLRKTGHFSKIGVLGHSEGGSIAFMLAAQKKCDFIVSMAGPGLRGDSIIVEQTNELLRQQGQPATMTVRQMRLTMLLQKTNPWYDYFVDFDPAPVIKQIKCPALLLNGDKDSQVMAASNIPVIRALLSDNEKHQLPDNQVIKVYPGLNHLFQHCTTGMPAEYGSIEETISEEVLHDIAEWIKNTTISKQ